MSLDQRDFSLPLLGEHGSAVVASIGNDGVLLWRSAEHWLLDSLRLYFRAVRVLTVRWIHVATHSPPR